jgi:hypothetical protein
MLAKYALTGLAASAMLATVAFAQSPSATTDKAAPAAAATDTSSFHGNWRASKVVGLSVYNDSNESIGSINELLMDKSGGIKAVVIGVGGFLGVGEHLVARTWVGEPTGATWERFIEIRHVEGDRLLARGRSVYAALDRSTGRPRRVDTLLRAPFA